MPQLLRQEGFAICARVSIMEQQVRTPSFSWELRAL
jgi:hypothetical protein